MHNPFVSEEDQPYPDQDALDVYDYLHARGPDTPFAPAKARHLEEEEEADDDESVKDEYTIDASGSAKLPQQQDHKNDETQVQKSMGDFYNDHWMKYFVDKHSGSTEAFERMNWSAAGSSHQGDAEGKGDVFAFLILHTFKSNVLSF